MKRKEVEVIEFHRLAYGTVMPWTKIIKTSSEFLRRQVKIYLQRVLFSPPSPVLATIQSILAHDVPRTEDVGLPTIFQFIVGPASQPIASLLSVNRLRRWPNTNPWLGLLYTLRKHVAFTQCYFSFKPLSLMLARHWNSLGWLYRVFWLQHVGDYAGDAFHPGARNTT